MKLTLQDNCIGDVCARWRWNNTFHGSYKPRVAMQLLTSQLGGIVTTLAILNICSCWL